MYYIHFAITVIAWPRTVLLPTRDREEMCEILQQPSELFTIKSRRNLVQKNEKIKQDQEPSNNS